MPLLDDGGLCRYIDAPLGAFGITRLAADTPCRHKAAGFLCFGRTEGKPNAFDWLLGKGKPFSRAFVNPEYGEGAAGAHIGIDLLHIGIFAEQVGQALRPDLPYPALHGHAEKDIFALQGGKGDILIGFEPLINALALGGQEVKTLSSESMMSMAQVTGCPSPSTVARYCTDSPAKALRLRLCSISPINDGLGLVPFADSIPLYQCLFAL